MTSYLTKQALVTALGEPNLWLSAEHYKTKEERLCEDVLDEYAIYINEEVNGGCIVYGKCSRGWLVNPSLRWPLFFLASKMVNTNVRV